MSIDTKAVLNEIDGVLGEWTALRSRSQYDDCSDLPPADIASVGSQLAACIERMAPPGSIYRRILADYLKKYDFTNVFGIPNLKGALDGLRADIAAGRHRSFEELVHAELFADLLDAAAHLLEEGWKDPAAVTAGAVLEEHLRKLALKTGIAVEAQNGKPKKADFLNAELAGADVYSKLDQKNVTAWLGLRNSAAHGKYTEYTKEQVSLLIQSLRDFVTRHPA
ncbi:hypothetical protein [Pyxidicoccus caerfyrddinensis]|uniref:hypothetical protein n=1 Tax=Pyxidicoccus caerfyrddinensis TaxID=2709663 RepID=UPI0013DB8615|nr:hypothetical protein [Pyxidicoccus caerfyrddinensis]